MSYATDGVAKVNEVSCVLSEFLGLLHPRRRFLAGREAVAQDTYATESIANLSKEKKGVTVTFIIYLEKAGFCGL